MTTAMKMGFIQWLGSWGLEWVHLKFGITDITEKKENRDWPPLGCLLERIPLLHIFILVSLKV